MRIFFILFVILILNSCNIVERGGEVIDDDVPERSELSMDSKIFLGNRLFSEKTCITCHALYKTKIGPSVVNIVKVYNEKNTSIEKFLKGESNPIVDTTASQVEIMQENIDGFLKKVTEEELNAIATYMFHVAKLEKSY